MGPPTGETPPSRVFLVTALQSRPPPQASFLEGGGGGGGGGKRKPGFRGCAKRRLLQHSLSMPDTLRDTHKCLKQNSKKHSQTPLGFCSFLLTSVVFPSFPPLTCSTLSSLNPTGGDFCTGFREWKLPSQLSQTLGLSLFPVCPLPRPSSVSAFFSPILSFFLFLYSFPLSLLFLPLVFTYFFSFSLCPHVPPFALVLLFLSLTSFFPLHFPHCIFPSLFSLQHTLTFTSILPPSHFTYLTLFFKLFLPSSFLTVISALTLSRHVTGYS